MLRTTLAASLLAGTALAQVQSPVELGQQILQFLSPQCQQTIVGLFNSSGEAYQCLQVDSLLPAILTNDSIIPPVDDYLSAVCYNEPCSSSTFNETINSVLTGCSTELNSYGIDNETVLEYAQYDYYLLARNIACLKTDEPISPANATIPANDTSYNTTNGTFCITDLATDLSAYLGVNLTNAYVDTAALGGNISALRALEVIPPTALCSDCVFAAVELINEEFPAFGQIVVNRTTNYTIDGYLNNTCEGTPYNVTNDGELPDSIVEAAVNETSSSNATSTILPTGTTSIAASVTSAAAGVTGTAAAAASSVGTAAGAMAEKKRWFGA